MKTIAEFIQALDDYFDGVKNKTVVQLIIDELRYIKPSDLDGLFRQLVISQPAMWKPDLKSVVDAIKALKLDTLAGPQFDTKCPVCGTISASSGVCPACKYAGKEDGTPEEYRAWWSRWKAGEEPRLDIDAIMRAIVEKNRVKE